ncbi:PREDICTED: BET1 homolog [Diuraphis noxia]|uniref:BET1 homolog n=1 Tax=Diuraphis noxia TaxID=143948 RepID=UPI000763B26C|nr:PREDICTED: BET1 homolog [Diuraphis noxia]XP_015363344.1 PREDICTED: BET1 homolog [Diuraphis noxia]
MMRRAHIRDYYDPPPSKSLHGSELIQIEDEDLPEHLKDKVNILKSLSIDIGSELKSQDRLLRDMDYDLETTGGFLSNTLGRVTRLYGYSGGYNKLYLILFSLIVFFILYIFLKLK